MEVRVVFIGNVTVVVHDDRFAVIFGDNKVTFDDGTENELTSSELTLRDVAAVAYYLGTSPDGATVRYSHDFDGLPEELVRHINDVIES